jgi:hypothetical protein
VPELKQTHFSSKFLLSRDKNFHYQKHEHQLRLYLQVMFLQPTIRCPSFCRHFMGEFLKGKKMFIN